MVLFPVKVPIASISLSLSPQMLNLDLLANGDNRRVNQEAINRAMQGLTKHRKEFISSCLEEDPAKRLTASALIKSRVFQEVCASVCTCICTCVYILHVHVYIHTYTHTYIHVLHTYIHTCATHTYIHT